MTDLVLVLLTWLLVCTTSTSYIINLSHNMRKCNFGHVHSWTFSHSAQLLHLVWSGCSLSALWISKNTMYFQADWSHYTNACWLTCYFDGSTCLTVHFLDLACYSIIPLGQQVLFSVLSQTSFCWVWLALGPSPPPVQQATWTQTQQVTGTSLQIRFFFFFSTRNHKEKRTY